MQLRYWAEFLVPTPQPIHLVVTGNPALLREADLMGQLTKKSWLF